MKNIWWNRNFALYLQKRKDLGRIATSLKMLKSPI